MLLTSCCNALRMVVVVCCATAPVALATASWRQLLLLALVGGAAAVVVRRLGCRDLPTATSRNERLADAAATWVAALVVCTGLTWGLASSAGAAAAALADPAGAIFETTSGLTTTGLTMVSRPDLLDPVLQWWRTVLQAAGGVGVVVFALVASEPSGDRDAQVGAEWNEAPPGSQSTTARRIVQLLAGVVGVATVGLVVTGEPLWRALNHAVTAAVTGGFALTPNSAADVSAPARAVLAVTLLVGATSFGTLWGTASRRGPRVWRRTQVRTFALLLLVLGGTAVGFAVAGGYAAVDAAFNAVSAATTAGFAAGDAHRFVPVVAILTTVAMLVGGAAGSTAGGIKVARVAWIWKSVRRWLPDEDGLADRPYAWDGEEVEADEAMQRIVGAGVLTALWLVTVLVAIVALRALVDAPTRDVALEVASAVSGTGLSSGLTGPDLGGAPKVVLAAVMLAGRLELTAFIALASLGLRRTHAPEAADGPDRVRVDA